MTQPIDPAAIARNVRQWRNEQNKRELKIKVRQARTEAEAPVRDLQTIHAEAAQFNVNILQLP